MLVQQPFNLSPLSEQDYTSDQRFANSFQVHVLSSNFSIQTLHE